MSGASAHLSPAGRAAASVNQGGLSVRNPEAFNNDYSETWG